VQRGTFPQKQLLRHIGFGPARRSILVERSQNPFSPYGCKVDQIRIDVGPLDFDEWMDGGWLEGEKKYVYPAGYKWSISHVTLHRGHHFKGFNFW
jgi:hypothetical protein